MALFQFVTLLTFNQNEAVVAELLWGHHACILSREEEG